jgi:hypothetical protein
MLSSSIVYAKPKTTDICTQDPDTDPATLTNTVTLFDPKIDKDVANGNKAMIIGGAKQSDYQNPLLGTGTLTMETLKMMRSRNQTGTDFEGWSISRVTLVIDDGPFGTGTLIGIANSEITFVMLRDPKYQMFSYATFHGKLQKEGDKPMVVTVLTEGLTFGNPMVPTSFKIVHLKTTIIY